MKKFGYRLATILDKTGDDIKYTETGTLEYFSDLVDLAKYYDIKRNDGRKAYKVSSTACIRSEAPYVRNKRYTGNDQYDR